MASPVTLTMVRHMSKGRSTAKISANPMASLSAGKPTSQTAHLVLADPQCQHKKTKEPDF